MGQHVTLDELYESHTAQEMGIENFPGVQERFNLTALIDNVLDPVWELIGPFRVNSGFRGDTLNELVGGTPKSQHRKGEAADIVPTDMELDEAFAKIVASEIPLDQCIKENKGGRAWLHLSYATRHENRRQALIIDGTGTRTYSPPR